MRFFSAATAVALVSVASLAAASPTGTFTLPSGASLPPRPSGTMSVHPHAGNATFHHGGHVNGTFPHGVAHKANGTFPHGPANDTHPHPHRPHNGTHSMTFTGSFSHHLPTSTPSGTIVPPTGSPTASLPSSMPSANIILPARAVDESKHKVVNGTSGIPHGHGNSTHAGGFRRPPHGGKGAGNATHPHPSGSFSGAHTHTGSFTFTKMRTHTRSATESAVPTTSAV